MALLVEKPGMPEKALKPGETIGQFKLVDVNTNEITFAWTFNGELARRSLRELADNSAPATQAQEVRPVTANVRAPAAGGEVGHRAGRSDRTGHQDLRSERQHAGRHAWLVVSGRRRGARPSANSACGIR